MYSFQNRGDTTVFDEPFYAHYLTTHPEIFHPSREEIINSQSSDFTELIDELIFDSYETENMFIKNMAHHLDQCDWSFLKPLKNVFLIRNPRQLIASFAKVIPEPRMLDIGLELQYSIYNYVKENGAEYHIIDSGEILKDPKIILTQLCERLNIKMMDKMLNWPTGPRKEDGVWAKHWYTNVHKSTGFAKQKTSSRPFPEKLKGLLEKAESYYDLLYSQSIKA